MSLTLTCGDAASQECGRSDDEGQPLVMAVTASQPTEIAEAVGAGTIVTFAATPAKRPFRLHPEWAQRGPFW